MNDRLPQGNGGTTIETTILPDANPEVLATAKASAETSGQPFSVLSWIRNNRAVAAGLAYVLLVTSGSAIKVLGSEDPSEIDKHQEAKGAAVLALTEAEIAALTASINPLDEALASPLEETDSPAETEVAAVHTSALLTLNEQH